MGYKLGASVEGEEWFTRYGGKYKDTDTDKKAVLLHCAITKKT
jgi:hypothetical protein